MPEEPPHSNDQTQDASELPHRRRPRYRGKHPRHFKDKYKELDPERHTDTVAKVLASGKTVAGTHRPIMVDEILEVLSPQPGTVAVDCTLGYGGHAQALLEKIMPDGHLIGFDADPIERPKTEARLRTLGFGPDVFTAVAGNFAGLPRALAERGHPSVDVILADLGLSSMQIDDPTRGFSVKFSGPLDMRMNPRHGQPASALLEKIRPDALATILAENGDEPHAASLAPQLAGRSFATTIQLAAAIRVALHDLDADEVDLSVRRVFQAVRIAVNDEFSALDMFLRHLPFCLKPGGRAAIMSFHSGEDRRVKKAFAAGHREGLYASVSDGPVRASAPERFTNPRSTSAKLRWAVRASLA